MSKKPATVSKNSVSAYELFVAAVSILSIFNILLGYVFHQTSILYVIGVMDIFLSIFFFIDFLQRFIQADNRRRYFFREFGWADLAASMPLPQFKIFRIFRLLKAYRIIHQVGIKKVTHEFFRNPASSALYLILFLIILLLEFGSIAILYVEGNDPAANIHTASDAIWWVYVTITTVGYGDKYPVTNQGRAIGMLVMLAGVGLFGVLTGFLANRFLPSQHYDEQKSSRKELELVHAELAQIKSELSKLSSNR